MKAEKGHRELLHSLREVCAAGEASGAFVWAPFCLHSFTVPCWQQCGLPGTLALATFHQTPVSIKLQPWNQGSLAEGWFEAFPRE